MWKSCLSLAVLAAVLVQPVVVDAQDDPTPTTADPTTEDENPTTVPGELPATGSTDPPATGATDPKQTTHAGAEVTSGSDGGGGDGSSDIEFDTLVRISSANCKATDIGRDYSPDGETTTTIDPNEAIESDSLYIGGDNNAVAGPVKVTCLKAGAGGVTNEKTYNIAIPSLVNLVDGEYPDIRLNECIKLSIERTDSDPLVSDEICFGTDAVEGCRTYSQAPSNGDLSLNASKPPTGEEPSSDWINVGGIGCNDPAGSLTTGGPPDSGSVMVRVSGVGMVVCALFALIY